MLPEKDDEGRQVFIFRLGNYVYCAIGTSILRDALFAFTRFGIKALVY